MIFIEVFWSKVYPIFTKWILENFTVIFFRPPHNSGIYVINWPKEDIAEIFLKVCAIHAFQADPEHMPMHGGAWETASHAFV